MTYFRDGHLSDFNGLHIDSNGKLNIPQPKETTESIALYVKRFFASEDERSKLVHYISFFKYYYLEDNVDVIWIS